MNSNIFEKFTILWIEDEYQKIESEMTEIGKYLKEKHAIEPKIIHRINTDNLIQTIQDENVDLIITDQNITDEQSGSRLIKQIRESQLFLDVLLYTARGSFDSNKLFKDLNGHYLFIAVDNMDYLGNTIKDLIDKNLNQWNNIMIKRGVVITRTIDLEIIINQIIIKFFTIPDTSQDIFHTFILDNYFQFQWKINIIREILKLLNKENDSKFTGLYKGLEKIGKSRNLLAHCRVDENDPTKLRSFSGTDKTFDQNKMKNIFQKISKVSKQLEELLNIPLIKITDE